MKYHNIERPGFFGRQYVGYSSDGRSWRISGKYGYWSATANVTRQGKLSVLIGFNTLAELSAKLGDVK